MVVVMDYILILTSHLTYHACKL